MAQTTALDRARQRALDSTQPKESGLRNISSVSQKPSGRFIETPEGRVPEEFYSLTPEQQKQFRALVKEEENNAAGESQFDRVSLALLDQQASQAKRVTKLERLVESLIGENLELRRRQDGINTSVETTKSAALVEQESAIAQQVTNLAAVKAEAESSATSIRRETEIQIANHQNRMAAIEQPIAELEGRVRSTTLLMGERSNAVISALGESESRQQKVSVQLVELENRSDALGSPITRPEMKAMVTTEVTAEVKAQAPELIDQQIRDDKELGVINPGGQTMDRAYAQQKRSDAEAFRANATRGLG